MKRIIKFIIGILLLPFVVTFSKMFYAQLAVLPFLGPKLHYLLWGIVLYMLVHILFWQPIYLYTLGHELIHVLSCWLCGGHVTSFHVSREGGAVTTSKTNFFVELSPYFVPIYTLLLIFIFPVIRYKLANAQFFSLYILVLGFSLGMHLIMTAVVIKMKQPDVAKSGYAFSFSIIYLSNLLLIFGVLSTLSPDISFKAYFIKSFNLAKHFYIEILR